MKIPRFVPTRTSTATTYHFKIDPPDAFGWALCTVNDGTGELLITSDYGNWSHRWSADPAHLGEPTLTHFIAGRSMCHYLADKLTRRKDRERFDARETVKHLQRLLCEQRLEQGRALIDWYRDEEPEDRVDVGDDWLKRTGGVEFREVWLCGSKEHWPLTKLIAREMFRELGRLADHMHVEGFVEAFNDIDGHEWICDDGHEELRHRPDTSYLVLRDGILPALVEACAAEVERRTQPPHRSELVAGADAIGPVVVVRAPVRFAALRARDCVPGAVVAAAIDEHDAREFAELLNANPKRTANFIWTTARLLAPDDWCVIDAPQGATLAFAEVTGG